MSLDFEGGVSVMANEDLLLRQMPHSLEGEQAVLGSMLIDADCVKMVVEKLKPADFYMRQNREIYETICSMFAAGKPIDGLTVAEEMNRSGVSDNNTRPYLGQLMDITPTSANVMEYAEIVAEKAKLRGLAAIGEQIVMMAKDPTTEARDAIEYAERTVFAVNNGRGTMSALNDILPEVLDKLGELCKNGGHLPGMSTGISAIDGKIMGLKPPDLILLAARPGMGKTALAVQIARNVGITGKAVAVFSLEMTKGQIVERLLSMEAMIDSRKIKTGALDVEDWESIANAVSKLSLMNILTDDNPFVSVTEISAKCRRIENLGLVIVDYLQLIETSGRTERKSENRQQAVSDISRMLKILAKELNVPVLCLSQLSRANEKRDNKRPMLSDLRESGAIEQDADIVMFLYRDDYYHEDTDKPGIAECIVAKNRHGEMGKVELRWMPEYTMFSTIEMRDEV